MADGYFVDAKYPDVAAALKALGWHAVRHWTFPTCRLRYVNYAKVQWANVKPNVIINHLHHAVLLSQKHELLAHLQRRPSIHAIFPRSVTSPDAWIPLFLYAQALLVLKNPAAFANHVTTALTIGAEIQRQNPRPSYARIHGLQMMDVKFLSDNEAALRPFFVMLPRTPTYEAVDADIQTAIDGILSHLEACDRQFHFVSTRNLWIAKPSGLSQGRGIELVTSLAEIHSVWAATGTPMVVQQYIERPLLIMGRKFDIRQWVLVTDVAPVVIYWYKSCYLRFSATDYCVAHDEALRDKTMHLCNNSVQKHVSAPAHHDIPEHMWPLQRFQQHLQEIGREEVWVERLCPAMQYACVEAIESVASKLRRVGKGFEWLGLDYIIDEAFNVWLLEVNVSPDVSHSTHTTAALVPEATKDMLALILHNDETRGWQRLDLDAVAAHGSQHCAA
ncbi:hypothetical protein ACHHYP_00188 [Achlya hypogyna]|uniref:Tubulin-tyrosine ligase family n=1 Tax=Achlya hypogyna TaxID=1202772 RepID=A0A1V9ZB67_ACHHY|nr:hypothetical protein ACHHYP_00188 [Achlya hypogyna]